MKQAKHSNLLFGSILGLILFGGFFGVYLPVATVHAQECNDGIDNDSDGYADYVGVPAKKLDPDPACHSEQDPSERDEKSGLIPCTDKCGLKDVFLLINNLIEFVITVLFFPFFIFILVYIGYKYFTADGNATKVASVKKIISNVIIGVLLILGAWLLVRSSLYAIGYTDSILFL